MRNLLWKEVVRRYSVAASSRIVGQVEHVKRLLRRSPDTEG